MISILIVSVFANAAPRVHKIPSPPPPGPTADEVGCLTALGKFQYGGRYAGASNDNRPLVHLTRDGYFVWDGATIRHTSVLDTFVKEGSRLGNPDRRSIPRVPRGRQVWPDDGTRALKPSIQRQLVQGFIADSFNNFFREFHRRKGGFPLIDSNTKADVLNSCQKVDSVKTKSWKSVSRAVAVLKATASAPNPIAKADESSDGVREDAP